MSSTHSWPFMSTVHKPALPLMSDVLGSEDPVEALRRRILELLARENRAMHTGMIAGALRVLTHQVQTALHHPYQTGKVHFTSSEGWSLAQPLTILHPPDNRQGAL